MDCRKVNSIISPYLDGALSNNEAAALAEHLSICSTCANEVSFQKRLAEALHEIGKDEIQAPPPSLAVW